MSELKQSHRRMNEVEASSTLCRCEDAERYRKLKADLLRTGWTSLKGEHFDARVDALDAVVEWEGK